MNKDFWATTWSALARRTKKTYRRDELCASMWAMGPPVDPHVRRAEYVVGGGRNTIDYDNVELDQSMSSQPQIEWNLSFFFSFRNVFARFHLISCVYIKRATDWTNRERWRGYVTVAVRIHIFVLDIVYKQLVMMHAFYFPVLGLVVTNCSDGNFEKESEQRWSLTVDAARLQPSSSDQCATQYRLGHGNVFWVQWWI
jgi:hypothetical protein